MVKQVNKIVFKIAHLLKQLFSGTSSKIFYLTITVYNKFYFFDTMPRKN